MMTVDWVEDYLDAWNSHDGIRMAAFVTRRLPATTKPYRIRGASIGDLNPDGKITANRDYWNLAACLIEAGLPGCLRPRASP